MSSSDKRAKKAPYQKGLTKLRMRNKLDKTDLTPCTSYTLPSRSCSAQNRRKDQNLPSLLPLLQPRHLPGHVQPVPRAHLRNCVGNLEVILGQTSITLKWVSGAISITSTSNKMKAALDITMWSFLNVGLEKYSGV